MNAETIHMPDRDAFSIHTIIKGDSPEEVSKAAGEPMIDVEIGGPLIHGIILRNTETPSEQTLELSVEFLTVRLPLRKILGSYIQGLGIGILDRNWDKPIEEISSIEEAAGSGWTGINMRKFQLAICREVLAIKKQITEIIDLPEWVISIIEDVKIGILGPQTKPENDYEDDDDEWGNEDDYEDDYGWDDDNCDDDNDKNRVPSLQIDEEAKTIRVSRFELNRFVNQSLQSIVDLKEAGERDGWTVIHIEDL
ncbi:hypothetical protein HOG48_01240 [Candidatus Peregrinibacteria bacterium]|jgi:hypothetical protein|nr:hypothetical protein [Candidatus Peregrinibacteria bacterium]